MISFAILLPAVAQSLRIFAMNHPIEFLFSNLEHVTIRINLQPLRQSIETK